MSIDISNCPATGKKRKVIGTLIIKEIDNNLRLHNTVDYFEDDGTTRAEDAAPRATRHLYRPIEVIGTTSGSWINPTTGQLFNGDLGEHTNQDGSIKDGLVPEVDYYRGIPCTTPISPNVMTVGDLLDFLNAQAVQLANLNGKI
jgi:hypothetical protein